jgi:hypothetical protein
MAAAAAPEGVTFVSKESPVVIIEYKDLMDSNKSAACQLTLSVAH